jgi:hypothetical protein
MLEKTRRFSSHIVKRLDKETGWLIAIPAGVIAFYFLQGSYLLDSATILLPAAFAIVVVGSWFYQLIKDVQKESKDYARKLDRSSDGLAQSAEVTKLLSTLDETTSIRIKEAVLSLREELDASNTAALDMADPDKLFQAARRRLLDEAIRIDSISRRNLTLGVAFSAIALGFLAWPLLAQTIFPTDPRAISVVPWVAQYYLPRFAVGLLLQFVGFFFLRLYVANELDLKHNKNEITNLEMKMIGLQLARSIGDAASKKRNHKVVCQYRTQFHIKKE